MPTDKEVSCSSSCPQIGHSLGQNTLQSTWVTPSVQERLQDHHKGPQEGSGWPRSTNSEAAAEAECPAPAPQGATADDAALWDTAQRIVSEAVRRAVAQIMAAGQEPEEQQDLAQHMDLQDENSKEGCQGGDTIQSTWINPSVQEHLQDAPAGPQEGSGLTSTDTEAAAEAERPAPAQHSPTEDDVDLSDIVEYIVSEAVRRAEAEIQGPGQQPVEQQDLAQCTDVPVAAAAPAGLEAIEAHLAGEDEGQANTAPLVPAAKEEEENTVSPMEMKALKATTLVLLLGLFSFGVYHMGRLGALTPWSTADLSETLPLPDQLRKLQERLYHLRWSAKDVTERALQEGLKQAKLPGVTGRAVHEIINQALEKLEAIQVPMADYALKSAGAAVIQSRTSPSLRTAKAKVFWYSLPVMDYMRSPELILEPDNHPGNCWPFPGSQGHVFIKLSMPVIPRAVTMAHVSGTAFHGESISGAPKDFAVYGFKEEHEEQGTFLGQFTFLAALNPSQTFQLKPNQVDVEQPPQIDAGWLPVYQFERRRVDSIVSFVSSPEKEESQKIPFLQNICDLCYNSKRHGPPQGLDLFCQRYGLAENIKVLLEEEPRNKLRTAVRWNAMLAIAELSAVERALEGKEASLLQACFSSVFLLPPEEKMQDMGRYLFLKTMEAMDNMLQALVLGSSASRVSELLQNIFQMLLTFTTSERECVQERAVGRIEKMSSALFRHPTLASYARYLRTSERTDIVLVFIEAMRDTSTFDKKRATDLLDMVMEFPDFWLADLPKIMRCIHKNLDGINTAPARQSVASLLLLMADRRPGKVLTTLLRIAPPGDSTALALWDMMISTPRPLKKILKNLRKRLLVIDSVFPAGVISGSESPDTARKIQSLLPQVVGLLDHSNTEVKRRVLTFFRSVMGHLKSEEARPTVEQLEEKLLPLFDDESSQLRELSICLFRERVQSVMAHDKKRIKSYVHRALLPLFFRLSDQSNNVAKLERDRSRAQELLSQSLPYLRDAQASLREAAVRFIALRPLETDSKSFVRSLAAQTIAILSSPREQPRSRWALQALCCWRR
ncbi:hypothetical protein Q9966_016672 [Columba livia]|nr:hypothetical protein Q9966_016672 [Columba livia]